MGLLYLAQRATGEMTFPPFFARNDADFKFNSFMSDYIYASSMRESSRSVVTRRIQGHKEDREKTDVLDSILRSIFGAFVGIGNIFRELIIDRKDLCAFILRNKINFGLFFCEYSAYFEKENCPCGMATGYTGVYEGQTLHRGFFQISFFDEKRIVILGKLNLKHNRVIALHS